MGKIMETFGLRDPNGTYGGIDYNERSPLVVPPTRDLPPPEAVDCAAGAELAERSGHVGAPEAKAKEKKVAPHPDYVADSSRPLRPERARSGRRAERQCAGRQQCKREFVMSDPRDQGVKKSLFSGDVHRRTNTRRSPASRRGKR